MSNYTKTVDFAAKDTLPSGDSGKIIKGTEFETEFDNISTAVATKADSAAPTFTGTSVFTNLDINGTVQADGAVTVGVDDTGYDVKFFGATAGKSLLWDESADTLIVTGTTTLVGTTNLDAVDVDGNMTFGDNNKAIFGAGSDLQIYSDGTTGQVTGDVNVTGGITATVTGNEDVLTLISTDADENSGPRLSLTRNSASPADNDYVGLIAFNGENSADESIRMGMIRTQVLDVTDGTEDSTLTFYSRHGGTETQRLATTATGIDVTGTVTADGLTVDGDVQINKTAPNLLLMESDTTDLNSAIYTTGGNLRVYTVNDAISAFTTRFNISHSTGDISFYNDAAAQGLFWDSSASRLGLGTSSPEKTLHVNSGTTNVVARFESTDADARIELVDSNSTGLSSISVSSDDMFFSTDSSEAMRIDASGNVRIGVAGTTTITGLTQTNLIVGSGTGGEIVAYRDDNGVAANDFVGAFLFGNDDNNTPEDHFAGMWAKSTSTQGNMDIHWSAGRLNYEADTPQMTLDASGNLGIGVAPEAWAAFNPVLRIKNAATGGGGALAGSGVDNFRMFANTYFDGAYKRLDTGFATQYGQESGAHVWSTATTGAGESTITWSESMRIDGNGNVGIGGTPTAPLHVFGGGILGASSTNPIAFTGSGGTNAGIGSYTANSDFNVYSAGTGDIKFVTGAVWSSAGVLTTVGSERMRIDSSGNLLVGTTSAGIGDAGIELRADGQITGTRDGDYAALLNRLTSDGDIIDFRKDGTTVGSISVTASATAYNTSSDQRLKENIADADDAGSKVDAIQVRKFDWKADGSHQDYGMIAQELLEVAPEAVSGDADSEEMMGVDYSKLVPMMLKEIQSLRARVAQLES